MSSTKQGTLHEQPDGRWVILCPGQELIALARDDKFLIEVGGKEGLHPTRMRCREFDVGVRSWYCEPYMLAEGLRAAIGGA